MLRPLKSTSGISKQLCFWIIFPHCVDISFIWFSCKHNQKNKTFQFSSDLEAAIHTSRTLSIMLRFVYLIFLCPSPSHATQENIVFDCHYSWSHIQIIHNNKNINRFFDHPDPLNSADGPWSLTFVWMLFYPKPHLKIIAFRIKPAMATALHDGSGLPAPHCITKWTIGNEQRFKTSTNSQDFSLARQSGETGCTLRTTQLKTVGCQHPHTLVTSRARFQQVGNRPASWWGPHCS